jgi:ribosomal protein S6--L-glutamate ligase
MILSYHPIIEAHRNIICAGREPNAQDLAAIRQADAVILHQGCYPSLYRMVRGNSPHWFPNMDVRFDFPGKCGQARLFERLDLPRPPTSCYATVEAYRRSPWPGPFPAVVKLDWGGEGDTVYKVTSTAGLAEALGVVERFEASGHFGFLVQQYIPSSHRVVRVAVVGTQLFSYWRIQPEGAPFGTAVSKGARIDAAADPPLQAAAREEVRRICHQTGIQLAGFDLLFDENDLARGLVRPLVLEINHFFGRRGLGGSDAYYRILEEEVDHWLSRLGLGPRFP